MRSTAIGERPTSRSELAGWYAGVLERQGKSGLSVGEYAAQVGLSAWTLYRWRLRLASAVGKSEAPPPKLVEVAIARQTSAPGSGNLVLHLGDSRRSITVPCGFDGDELRRLIGVLESC